MSSPKNSHSWRVIQDGQRSIQISWRHTTSGETWSSVQQHAHTQSRRSLLGTPVSINSRTTAHTKALFTDRRAWNCEGVLNRRQPSSQYRNVLPLVMRTNTKERNAYKAVYILIIIINPIQEDISLWNKIIQIEQQFQTNLYHVLKLFRERQRVLENCVCICCMRV
jgi:hypothetical protein